MEHRETDSRNKDREVTDCSDGVHRETDSGKEAEFEATMDDRTQVVLHELVEQEDEVRRKVISNLVQALIKDLSLQPFSEESAHTIHDMGNVEYFEMCGTPTKVQCTYCFKYRAIGVVYCTCGMCLESKEIRLLIDSQLHHQEESVSWCPTR